MNSPTAEPPVVGDLGAGHSLGRYELLMPIASGGMAMVWAARLKGSRGFQKIVAVKTMLPKLNDDPQFEQMFLDEASLASQVRHPHVVEILDLGEQHGVLYLVMEWIDGVPLNQVLKAARQRGGVPLSVAVRICMQACAGLHAAHELTDASGRLVGLVHRDISPQNVLVTYDGVGKVVDFGVAKATAVGSAITQGGQIKGKIAYMAPEQIRGNAIDRRIDVFSMGAVLYLLTTGKHPFRRETEGATMFNICSPDPALPPRRLLPKYPHALEGVVLKALAKDPNRRYATANELLRALDQSLPASMRASTDEEVASFVRDLFGEQRERQKNALQAALARADERAEKNRERLNSQQSAVELRELLDSQPPPSVQTASGISAVSLAQALEIPSSTATPGLGETPRKSRALTRLLIAAAALVVGTLTALYAVRGLRQRGHAPDTVAAITPPTPITLPTETKPVLVLPVSETTAVKATSIEAPATTSAPERATPAKRNVAGSSSAKPKAGPSTGAPAWKQDPGF